jgi:putative exosortase-associated protein (TIGR04073 family)
MRNSNLILASLALVAALGAGCANTENKLGRGISNTFEVSRMGEFENSFESESLTGGGVATGLVKGFNKTVARTGVGIYEIVSAPFPPYHPVCTNYLSPVPAHPGSYERGHVSDITFDVDSETGFSGGEVLPLFPGSRFSVFEN